MYTLEITKKFTSGTKAGLSITERTSYSTAEFEAAHGHKPRGYGAWIFKPKSDSTPAEYLTVFGLYGAAKKAALNHARSHRWAQVNLAP